MLRQRFRMLFLRMALFLCCGMEGPIRTSAQSDHSRDVPMTRPEECLAVTDNIAHHASFVELSGGKILMAWGGIRYPIWFATSEDGGLTWSSPSEAYDTTGQLIGGHDTSSLIHLAGKSIGYVNRSRGALGRSKGSKTGPEHLLFWRSDDEGKTWQSPVRIGPPTDYELSCIHDGFMRTSSGRIILPVYGRMELAKDPSYLQPESGALFKNQWVRIGVHEYDSTFSWSFVYYSDDDGRTWKSSRSGKLVVWDHERMVWHKTAQPTVAEVSPGQLLMLLRTQLGRLYQSWSLDNGETWSAPQPTNLASSLFPAQLRRVPVTGDLMVLWTQVSQDEIRKGLGRSRMSTAISRVHGAQGSIWEFYQNIESCLEGTRVEPGPIGSVRSEGYFYRQGQPGPEREPRFVVDLPEKFVMVACPSVFFYKDRILISMAYEGQYNGDGTHVYGRLKVVPVSWLYGGMDQSKPNEFHKELQKRFPAK